MKRYGGWVLQLSIPRGKTSLRRHMPPRKEGAGEPLGNVGDSQRERSEQTLKSELVCSSSEDQEWRERGIKQEKRGQSPRGRDPYTAQGFWPS